MKSSVDEPRQGDVLSPTPFNVFMDGIMNICTTKIEKQHVRYRKLRDVKISEFYYIVNLGFIKQFVYLIFKCRRPIGMLLVIQSK